MPFKSQAQRRKFAQLLVEGKISPETFEEWNREGGRKLRERAADADKRKRKSAKKKTVGRAKAPSVRTRKTTKRALTKR